MTSELLRAWIEKATATARKLAKDYIFVGAAIVLLTLLVVVYATMFRIGLEAPDRKPPSHVHCPECGEEFAYSKDALGRECPVCKSARLVRGRKDEGDVGFAASWGRMLAFLVASAVLLQGLAYFGVIRMKAIQRLEQSSLSRVLVCRCPFCKRKLGYTLRSIGTGVTCPRCKTAFQLPAPGGDGFEHEHNGPVKE